MKQTANDRGRTLDFIDIKNGISGGPAVRSILSNRVTYIYNICIHIKYQKFQLQHLQKEEHTSQHLQVLLKEVLTEYDPKLLYNASLRQ